MSKVVLIVLLVFTVFSGVAVAGWQGEYYVASPSEIVDLNAPPSSPSLRVGNPTPCVAPQIAAWTWS